MVRIKDVATGIKQGDRRGAWTVLGKPFAGPSKPDQSIWFVVCRCDCGAVEVVRTGNLANGSSPSCRRCGNTIHGHSGKRLHSIWRGMKKRCYVKSTKNYVGYGGRGIEMCKEWLESFEVFEAWSLANGYADDLEIDRINNDGNYEPANCRWVTPQVNSSNKRNTRNVTAFGETKTLTEWSRDARCQVPFSVLHYRLVNGWKSEEAITVPSRKGSQKCYV